MLPDRSNDDQVWAIYGTIGTLTGLVAFVVSWLYSVASYGLFLGIGLGWLPSAVVGVVVGFLWPLVALAGFLFGVVLVAG